MIIKEYKEPQHKLVSQKFFSPKRLYLFLSQHTGRPSIPVVEIGKTVKEKELIAKEDGFISARLHSPKSGKIVDIKYHKHPILKISKCIVIDCIEEKEEVKDKIDYKNFSKEKLLEIIKDSGVVGMGGAAFPTHVKLSPKVNIDTLIINGCECEPYLASDNRLMIENTKEIFEGIKIISKIIEPKDIIFAIEDNKEEAVKIVEDFINSKRDEFKNLKLAILKTEYPAGGEKQLIYKLTKRKVPSGKLPFDVGCLVQNVATCFAIYEAVCFNKPLIERLTTFAGDALLEPKNIWVKIGTTLKELFENKILEFKKEPKKIICGGPMMGVALDDLDYPILKGTGGFLFLENDISIKEEDPCIRCGNCIRACPMNLMPCMINLYSLKGLLKEAKSFGANDCIECGLCSYVCPANRRLVQSIKLTKLS